MLLLDDDRVWAYRWFFFLFFFLITVVELDGTLEGVGRAPR